MSNIKKTTFLALDLGATSGRAIVGTIKNNKLDLKEINRFSNPIIEINGRSYWDLFHLHNEIIKSIRIVSKNEIPITSIGIDTWGVDFVCFGKDGEVLRMPYSYRDSHTNNAPEIFFKKLSKDIVYRKTGIQIMNFNSLYQLDTQQREESSIYPVIDKILFMPDALSYLLTGNMVTEYTIASTSQMINPYDKKFDADLLDAVGLSEDNFAPIVYSGSEIGKLSDDIKQQTGAKNISVIAVAGHDTASAVLATPAENNNFAYLSSGTWSLIGIESDNPVITDDTFELNFTNEGGADGSIRLLKNICGMWLIEQCKREWDINGELSYPEIVAEAQKAKPFQSFINPDSPSFASPVSMINEIQRYCEDTNQPIPKTVGEISRCIYESLAFRYNQVLKNLKQLSDKPIEKLHIIGGGSNNKMLNQLTANAINMEVVSGPSEATAIGNIMLQAQAAGLVRNKSEIRDIIRNSVDIETFTPEDIEEWNTNYTKYLEVFK